MHLSEAQKSNKSTDLESQGWFLLKTRKLCRPVVCTESSEWPRNAGSLVFVWNLPEPFACSNRYFSQIRRQRSNICRSTDSKTVDKLPNWHSLLPDYLLYHNCLSSSNRQFSDLAPRKLKAPDAQNCTCGTSTLGNMKLRSRTKISTDNSSNVTANALVVLPNITRLQTPPISELSNAGSTIARKDRLLEVSSSITDTSDEEEPVDSATPTKNRPRPTVTVPAAPLTKKNLVKHQEEITSAVENASEDEGPLLPATLNARLIQARNFLLAENTDSYPGFATRVEQIENYMRKIPLEQAKLYPSIYNEVQRLLRIHRICIITGGEPPIQPRLPPQKTLEHASGPVASLLAEDGHDSEEQADPFEWTNKLDDLTHRVKQSPSGGKEAYAAIELRKLAQPLNDGLLPSAEEAYRLIDEQLTKESREINPSNGINYDQDWAFEQDFSPVSKEKKFSLDSLDSLDRWSAHPPERSRVSMLRLGEGNLMPQEMKDIDWDRDRSKLEESSIGYEDVDRGEAQLLLAETPFLQALMSEQIESDLAPSTYYCSWQCFPGEDTNADREVGAAGVKNGTEMEPVPPKPPVLMTQKFALPKPAQSRIDEALSSFCPLLQCASNIC